MKTKEMYYVVQFHYDNPLFELFMDSNLKNKIEAEYSRLRSIACERINPNYERWNSEFDGPEPDADDELADFGGAAYCEFIRSKQDKILNKINLKEATFVKLRSTKECDIGGEVVHKGITLTTFYITLKPYDK